jgi:hypothetical protein
MPKIHLNLYNENDNTNQLLLDQQQQQQNQYSSFNIPFIGRILRYQTIIEEEIMTDDYYKRYDTTIEDEKHYHLAAWYCLIFGIALAFVVAFVIIFKFQISNCIDKIVSMKPSNTKATSSPQTQCISVMVDEDDYWQNPRDSNTTRKHM